MDLANIAFALLDVNITASDSVEIAKASDLLLKFHRTCIERFDRVQAIMSHRVIFQKTWDYALDPLNRKKSIVLDGANRKMQSIIDIVLKPMLGKSSTLLAYVESVVSRYFLLFIQGITLFHDDGPDIIGKMGKPAYHRSASCGPKNATVQYKQENLSCDKQNVQDVDEIRRRKRNSWNCMIERKMYNLSLIHI